MYTGLKSKPEQEPHQIHTVLGLLYRASLGGHATPSESKIPAAGAPGRHEGRAVFNRGPRQFQRVPRQVAGDLMWTDSGQI